MVNQVQACFFYLYILVTHLISLISYIITNLQGSHVHLPVIYLMFCDITCLLVPVHFEFPHHKYIMLLLFIFAKLKHSPLSNIILKFIIFSPLFFPLSTPLQCARNFPKTFSQNLPMSDDLGIPKKFSYPNFQQLSLRFQRTSSFLVFLK